MGHILECKQHENADKLFVSQIKIDHDDPVQVCSGLVGYIPRDNMVDRRVVVLTNLKPSKMRGVKSEAMLLAAELNNQVDLVSPPKSSAVGAKLYFEGFEGPDAGRLKSKVWEEIAKNLRTNSSGEPVFILDGKEYRLRGEGDDVATSSLADAVVR